MIIETMDQLVHDIPLLPGALCKGHPEAFDIEDGHRQRAEVKVAVAQCLSCPALEPCRAWLAGLRPSERPSGVVAGKLVHPPVPRPLAVPGVKPSPPDPVDRAVDFLRCRLAGGSVSPSAAIKHDALLAKIGKHQLHAARARLGVVVDRVGQRETSWSLPTARKAPMNDIPSGHNVAYEYYDPDDMCFRRDRADYVAEPVTVDSIRRRREERGE